MKIAYITNRIGLADRAASVAAVAQQAQHLHGQFYHVFNVGGTDMQTFQSLKEKVTHFKYRPFPFSLKETFTVCLMMDKFLRAKVGNVAILFDPGQEFGCFIASCYLFLCGRLRDISKAHQYCCHKLNRKKLPRQLFQNIRQLFEGHPYYPVLRHVRAVRINTNKLPVFEILTEGRFQQLSVSYRHDIQPQLEDYYYNLPVAKYCDRQPVTDHLIVPANILGDFVVKFYNYQNLVHQPKCVLAHNTLFLQGSTLELKAQDLYNCEDPNATVTIEFEAVCSCTTEQPWEQRCYHCSTLVKTLKKDYSQLKQCIGVHRVSTQQFIRTNNAKMSSMLCFGRSEFDDAHDFE